jgi:TRAP-type C4-dicarboxylate transport system permease small subunit
MLKTFFKINQVLIKFLELVVIIVTGLLVLDVVWQVFTRYILRNPSTWTDELAVMLLIWVSLLGASVGFIRSSHLGVDFVVNKLVGQKRTIAEIAAYILIALFALFVLVYGGYRLVSVTLITQQTSAALRVKMGYVYAAIPISGVFILLFCVQTVIQKVKSLGERLS